LYKTFTPSFWMKNRHIQTLYQTFFREKLNIHFEMETFTLSDGDFLECYWHVPNNSQVNTPIVILFHGLAGSFYSPYIQGMMQTLSQQGYKTVLMHFGSCSGTLNKLPRSYHSGETNDAREYIQSLQKRFNKAKLYAVGFSLGGNMLLKLLGEEKENSLLNAAIAISPPMQLDTCANAINKGFSKIYQRHLIGLLNSSLKKKYSLHDMQSLIGISKEDVGKIKTFWEFDAIYTAPVHGFNSVQEYYSQSSSKQFLQYIQKPTLIIHSQDDPFMDISVIPSNTEVSKYVNLEITRNGGHVGFIEGSFFKPKYWLEKKVLLFLESYND
jgi:uncharacterized protein